MLAASDKVINWLSNLSTDSPPAIVPFKNSLAEQPCRKRRLPSPPMSDVEPSGRKRLCPGSDPDATPTRPVASILGDFNIAGSSDWSSTTGSSPSKKSRSKTGSPTKGYALLQLDHIVKHQSLTGEEEPPQAVIDMIQAIKQDAIGMGILTQEDKNDIQKSIRQDYLFRDLLRLPVDGSGNRSELGRLPPAEVLYDIWQEARKCERAGHSEPSWNCAVHYPLLKVALRYAKINYPETEGSQKEQHNFKVTAVNVTTAQISRSYAPRLLGSRREKRVDFCMCIEPDWGSPLSDLIHQVARLSPHSSINHTDYAPLLNCPISVSIETKRPGEDWQSALTQTSTWLSAQWKRLRELASMNSASERLVFLPGIIVQGHDWNFVVATQGRNSNTDALDVETVIWSKIPFGSTDGIQGICQIVTVLQRLARWSGKEYWDWMQAEVLNKYGQV